jgi:hypothetical protein
MNGRRNGPGGKVKSVGGGNGGDSSAGAARTPEVRVAARESEATGPAARIYLRTESRGEVDLTPCLTAAIAHCLWEARGGADVDNWVEAERVLCAIAGVKPPPAAGGKRESGAAGPLPEPSGPMPVVTTPRRAAGRT